MSNKKVTSRALASIAAHTLSNSSSSSIAKQLAGSVLSQVNKENETGKSMETIASNVLKSDKYSETTKQLAASILSQSDSKR